MNNSVSSHPPTVSHHHNSDGKQPQSIPAQSIPTQSIPAQSIPAQSIPTQSIPAQSIPTQSIPTQSIPDAEAQLGIQPPPVLAKTLVDMLRHWQHHLALALAPACSSRWCKQQDGHSDQHTPGSVPSPPDHFSLNRMINHVIIRLLWLSACEHHQIIPKGTLLRLGQQPQAYKGWLRWLQKLYPINHDLPQNIYSNLWISDTVFHPILSQAARLSCHCRPPEVLLGQVYEYLLAHPLNNLAKGTGGCHDQASLLPQPSVKKAQGIYYTPVGVVENMVEQTLGRYQREASQQDASQQDASQQDASQQEIESVTILDPACGSGIFLAIAYRRLLQWYRHADCQKTALEILQRHIYGVDLDPQAVELARLSLLLVLWSDAPSTLCSRGANL
ncbi:MAG: N-6 DNA methylase, partial [Cyanothece sp. SIO2G6]|nr:N-6 DNA methylase [Cyanothece sp. SIO2G6]